MCQQTSTPVKELLVKLENNTPKSREIAMNAIRDYSSLNEINQCKAKQALKFERTSPCFLCGEECEKDDKLRVLHSCFQFKNFRDDQEEIIDYLLQTERKAVVVVKPTSYGKSLLYELPCMYGKQIKKEKQLSLVVVPFVALCLDAKSRCIKLGLSVLHIDKRMSVEAAIAILETQPVDIVFITPEKIMYNSGFMEYIVEKHNVTSVVIDECHSIPETAFTFRGSMGKLAETIQTVGLSSKTLLMSATLSPGYLEQLLHLFNYDANDYKLYVADCYRDNFRITVLPKDEGKEAHDQNLYTVVAKLHLSEKRTNEAEATLVYSRTRDRAEELQTLLLPLDSNGRHFHAGISASTKEDIVSEFKEKKCNLISMTSGFGQGIDRDNVSSVVFDTIPNSTSSFLQIIGRCRRDGRGDADVVVFYSESDVEKIAAMIKTPQKGLPYNRDAIEIKLTDLQTISTVLKSKVICINNLLAKVQFSSAKKACGKCSNCLLNDISSYQQIDQSIISLIFELTESLKDKDDVAKRTSELLNMDESLIMLIITELINEGYMTFLYESKNKVLKSILVRTNKKYLPSMYSFYINNNVYMIDFKNIPGVNCAPSAQSSRLVRRTENMSNEEPKRGSELKSNIGTPLSRSSAAVSMNRDEVNRGKTCQTNKRSSNCNAKETKHQDGKRRAYSKRDVLDSQLRCDITDESNAYTCQLCDVRISTFKTAEDHVKSVHNFKIKAIDVFCVKCNVAVGVFIPSVALKKINRHVIKH